MYCKEHDTTKTKDNTIQTTNKQSNKLTQTQAVGNICVQHKILVLYLIHSNDSVYITNYIYQYKSINQHI